MNGPLSQLLYSSLHLNLESLLTAEPMGLGCSFLDTIEILDVSLMSENARLIPSIVHELREPEDVKLGPQNAGWVIALLGLSRHQFLLDLRSEYLK